MPTGQVEDTGWKITIGDGIQKRVNPAKSESGKLAGLKCWPGSYIPRSPVARMPANTEWTTSRASGRSKEAAKQVSIH